MDCPPFFDTECCLNHHLSTAPDAAQIRPRVLMLCTQLGYGGAETSFIRLANFLAQSMDVTVALFTASYGRSDYADGHEALNARVTLLDVSGDNQLRRWLRRVARVRALKAAHGVTISFLSGPNLVNVLAGGHEKTVVSLRGSRLLDPVSPPLQRLLFRHLIDPFIYRRAARMVPVSPGLIHEIRWAAGARAAARAQAISPFIDTARLGARLAAPPPEPYGALKGQPVIVAAGRLSTEKGFQHLLRVVSGMASHRAPAIKLLLIGDGPMRGALVEQAQALGLAVDDLSPGTPSVLFTGYQPDVLPLMRLGSLLVLPSATEGFPNTLLEAMAAGLPILAADTPWGARFILDPRQAAGAELYPTQAPRRTAYGTLMPRIDLPEYDVCWAEEIAAQLYTPTSYSSRIAEFDVATIGNQWKQLIHDLL